MANRLDDIPAILHRPMTTHEIAAALELNWQNVRARIYALVKTGELEVALPRAPSTQPQRYQRAAQATSNAFQTVRTRVTTGQPRSTGS